MAHNNWELLRTLLNCIDDARNEVFLHIDAKVSKFPDFVMQNARLHLIEERVDVHWGDLSVVEAELALFKASRAQGHYEYFHLLSGVDLPLKSQDYIHDFCSQHKGKEFIGYTLTTITPEVVRKVQRWHLFPEDFKGQSHIKRILRAFFIRIQELLGIKRNKGIDFKKGSQWVSITENMVDAILKRQDWIRHTFTHTFCADEIYKHTICWNSPLKDDIYCTTDDAKGCMRAIGWGDGALRDWGVADFEKLASNRALFARKFNENDMAFINKIVELLCQN